MKKLIIGFLAVVGFLTLLATLAAMGLGILSLAAGDRLPSRVVLEIDFEAGVIESIPDDALARLTLEGIPELRDLIDALEQAADDDRVEAVYARIGGGGIGLAHLQEIRDAVLRFRESGKPAVAFAETFGEFGPGNGGYYLATAFDTIYLQPSGDVALTGLMYESSFVRGLLDKLDVLPELDQRHEFKNAMNFYTEQRYTEPHRRAMQELMDSQFGQLVRGIAYARGLDEARVRELFDQGPFLGETAREMQLVDDLAYRDEVIEQLREQVGERAKLVSFQRYLRAAGRPNRRGETIALIQGYGTVVRGPSGYSPVDGSVRMGSDSIADAFRAAIDDDRVQAILFRVDSPGGSFVGSDTIWRETIRARDAGKPVIVSMGNLAGSGGYFVAMHADKIVAQPGTITASIGVLGGKLVTRGFWDKIGVTWDDVQTSAHASMWSATHRYGPSLERFQAMLDRIYEDFTGKVSDGRELPIEEVLEIAKGRIWTGEAALEIGLVDELGGMDVALRLAREAAGLEPDARVRLKRFPPRRSTWALLFEGAESADRTSVALARALRSIQPAMKTLRQLGLATDEQVLSMPDVPAVD